ncbi:MAG: DNA methyltransferase [Candidatus Helarchaeota archaeon]
MVRINWGYQERDVPKQELQIIEIYNTGEKDKIWSDIHQMESSRPENLLILGDNLYILQALKEWYLKKIKLIYCDPPFFAGSMESLDIPLRGGNDSIKNIRTAIKNFGYKNILENPQDISPFIEWFRERCRLMKPLIVDDGFIAIRYDYHYGHYVKIILDDVFGRENFICEFQVRRMIKNIAKKQLYTQTHVIVGTDSIFLYRKSDKSRANINLIRKVKRSSGLAFESEQSNDNIWFDIVGYSKLKKTFYPTENSEVLLERLIKLCSNQGDWVADFFMGSGTTDAVAERLGRKWIGVDIGTMAIHETKKRLLSFQPPARFMLLKLKQMNKEDTPMANSSAQNPKFEISHQVQGNKVIIRLENYNFNPENINSIQVVKHLENSLDLLDYCAIDWDYHVGTPFKPTQIYFRKFKNKRVIETIPAQVEHTYPNSGEYLILIKLMNIFGIESTSYQQVNFNKVSEHCNKVGE